jgi:exosome complex exonuclease RRP6
MLLYARSDTHFLLYIYDNLRNALLDRAQTSPLETSLSSTTRGNPAHALVYDVLSRSEETALRVYEKEVYDPEGGGPGGWDNMAKKWNKGMLTAGAPNSLERDIYKQLHSWRAHVAREEDESSR